MTNNEFFKLYADTHPIELIDLIKSKQHYCALTCGVCSLQSECSTQNGTKLPTISEISLNNFKLTNPEYFI